MSRQRDYINGTPSETAARLREAFKRKPKIRRKFKQLSDGLWVELRRRRSKQA